MTGALDPPPKPAEGPVETVHIDEDSVSMSPVDAPTKGGSSTSSTGPPVVGLAANEGEEAPPMLSFSDAHDGAPAILFTGTAPIRHSLTV